MPQRRIILCIPVYNERSGVADLIAWSDTVRRPLNGSRLEILFVNDGSSDGTGDLLDEWSRCSDRVSVLHHNTNRGLGSALKTLFDHALPSLSDDDLIVVMDGDGTHDPGAVTHMVAKLDAEDLDLIIASRFAAGARQVGVSLWRRFLSRGASAFFRLLFPITGVRDYSSGYRVYRVSLLRRCIQTWGQLVTVGGFDSVAEMTAKCSRLRPVAGEYPLILRYDRKQGRSKLPVVRTTLGYLRLVGKVRSVP